MQARGLALGVAVLAAATADAGEIFELVRLTEGVYAALVKPRPPTYVFANALVVVGSDAVLVVDSHQSPSAAEEIVSEVRKLTAAPVKFVVNTHWHGDHVQGNEAYREDFPGVSFVGHHRTRDGVLDGGANNLAEELRTLPESIRERESMLASEELTPEERERADYSRRARSRYLEELRSLTLLPPDVTFSDRLAIELGGLRVELHHLGPAHTAGDVVVHLPAERILAVGDLLEDAFPYFGDAYPTGWAAALDAVAAFDAGWIVPSHGPVLRDRELLDVEKSLLRALVTEVAREVARGATLAEARSRVSLEEFRSFFTGDAPERAEAFREAVGAAVERAYLEVRGEIPD